MWNILHETVSSREILNQPVFIFLLIPSKMNYQTDWHSVWKTVRFKKTMSLPPRLCRRLGEGNRRTDDQPTRGKATDEPTLTDVQRMLTVSKIGSGVSKLSTSFESLFYTCILVSVRQRLLQKRRSCSTNLIKQESSRQSPTQSVFRGLRASTPPTSFVI